MANPIWTPGTFYVPGATVRPATTTPVSTPEIPNASFESGNVEWTTGANWTITTQFDGDDPVFAGLRYAYFAGSGASDSRIVSQTNFPVRVGQRIRASCMVLRGKFTGGRIELDWLDANEVLLFSSQGNTIETRHSFQGDWRKSEVEAFAPAGAAFVRVAGFGYRTESSFKLYLDAFTWDYSYAPEGSGLVFTAVQTDAGFSGTTEPLWPSVNGQQVVDNEVIWEAIDGSRVVWEATPIIVSDYYEPDWPLEVGASVADNTAVWTAVSRRVTDEKCPNSAVVAIASSKVFAADDDVIGFCATVNPLDWVAEEDAGYLPFGLQNFGAMPVKAMGLYRGNLAAFNSQGYQIWQIGEDPETHALLDSGPIGCIWPRTPLAVMNDLVFLSAVGVRNIGVAGASTNLQVGNLGQAIDSLVIEKLRDDNPYSRADDPFSLYIPAYGQYWLIFGAEAFVLTINGAKQMSWSRYEFSEAITDWTLDGDELLLRTVNNRVWRLSDEALYDDTRINDYEGGDNIPFSGLAHWPHLDLGSFGVEKQFVGFDLVATAPEGVSVSIGYDQRDLDARTVPYTMDADSLPGKLVPIVVTAPSFDMKLVFAPGQRWEWQAACLYINDRRPGA